MRILSVDDEPLGRDNVRLALAGEPDVDLFAECRDGHEAVRAIRELAPDLVYLDVQMPGLSGFDVIDQVGAAHMPQVVFVTAYEEHALRAFAVHALDYLLKPFSDGRFRESLRRARGRLAAGAPQAARLQALVDEDRQRGGGWPRWLTVAEGDARRLVRIADVDWFTTEGNYVRVHIGAEQHLLRSTLGALLERLDPAVFVRIHRSVVVNLGRVKSVVPWAGGDYVALLHDGRQLRVSRHYKDALLRPFL